MAAHVLIAVFVGAVVVSLGAVLVLHMYLDSPLPALAWGLGCGYFVTAAIRLYYVNQFVKMQGRKMFWYCYGQLLIIMVPLASVGYYVLYALQVEKLLGRFAIAIILAISAVVLFCLLFVADDEKATARRLFSGIQFKLMSFLSPKLRSS